MSQNNCKNVYKIDTPTCRVPESVSFHVESPGEWREGCGWQLLLSPFTSRAPGPGEFGRLSRVEEETSQVIGLRARGLPTPWPLARDSPLTPSDTFSLPRLWLRPCACVCVCA